MTLLEQCQAWHNHGDYEKIIAAIEEIPAAERTPELDGELARAYNNFAQPSEWWYFKKAIDLLTPHAEDSADDHVWNFRMGYAYYYLDQENRALPYFEAALAALPGDEDTEQMIEDCRRGLPYRLATLATSPARRGKRIYRHPMPPPYDTGEGDREAVVGALVPSPTRNTKCAIFAGCRRAC